MVSILSSCYDDVLACISGICEAAGYEQSWSRVHGRLGRPYVITCVGKENNN